MFGNCLIIFSRLTSSLISLQSKYTLIIILIILNVLKCFVGRNQPILVHVLWAIGKIWIPLLLFGVFYNCLFDPVGWQCCWMCLYPHQFLSSCPISCWEEGLKSPSIIFVYLFVCFCHMLFVVLLFGVYTFKVALFPCRTLLSSCNIPFCPWSFSFAL